MRKPVVVALVATLMLAGCAAAPDVPMYGPTTGVGTADATTPPTTDEATRNDRGNIVKATGEPMRIGSAGASGVLAEFAVTSIVVSPSCTGDASAVPTNGYFVQFNFEGRTAPDLRERVKLDPSMWTAVDAQDELVQSSVGSTAASSCLPAESYLPESVGAGESVHGAIVFDVPSASGSLVLKAPDALTGIEWVYPQ